MRSSAVAVFNVLVFLHMVVLTDEPIITVSLGSFRRDPPEQKIAQRVALHHTVRQRANLFRSPNKFPLNGGQDVLVRGDHVRHILDSETRLVHLPSPCAISCVRGQ